MSSRELGSYYRVFNEYMRRKMAIMAIIENEDERSRLENLDTATDTLDPDGIDPQNEPCVYNPVTAKKVFHG